MRRKSVFSKWTLVLTVVLLCPYVYSRPQDASPTSVSDSAHVDKPTENPIRYRYRNDSISYRYKLPVLTNIYASQSEYAYSSIKNNSTKSLPESSKLLRDRMNSLSNTNRRSRLLTKKIVTNSNNKNRKKNNSHSSHAHQPTQRVPLAQNHKKTEIKKVITKWTDNTKYEDFDFTYETTLSNEIGKNRFTIADDESSEEFSSTESINDFSTEVSKKHGHRKPVKQLLNKIKNKLHNRPKPQYSEEQVQSDNIYVTAGHLYPTTRPIYIFSTPTPTPIITNVGNPKPWSKPQNFQVVYQNPTTPRPIIVTKPLKDHHNYHNPVYNNYPHYPGHEFEVTTFQPANAYTDRIVIRPEEYAASPDECPTIFLTLNNTFQGQAKEACPDLNIAVNTNVVNKNVVVESEEDDTDGIFSDPFGAPFGDDSGDETGDDHSYDSEENQEQVESASIEGLALTNYNAASDGESAEPGGFGSPSSVLSSLSRPGRPHEDDDDSYSFSSLIQFFKPAINALGWLATISPLSFGVFSLLLAPVVFLFAGTSGIAALFAPWAFSAREAPKIVHIHHPHWHWDDEIKTWQLHSFPHNRKWNPSLPRSSIEAESTNLGSVRPTLFYKLKEWMRATTQKLRQSNRSKISNESNRKNKRKKRETWAIRVK